jgi:1,4-alpha-glucan branching enzyme
MTNANLGAWDLHLFNEGTHSHAYDKLGAHPDQKAGTDGTHFAVWAPNAKRVGVIGDWNGWGEPSWLSPTQNSGIWEGFVAGVRHGHAYKYRVESNAGDYRVDKADPYAFCAEVSPRTASRVWQATFEWQDDEWLERRAAAQSLGSPVSIYEVHLGLVRYRFFVVVFVTTSPLAAVPRSFCWLRFSAVCCLLLLLFLRLLLFSLLAPGQRGQ